MGRCQKVPKFDCKSQFPIAYVRNVRDGHVHTYSTMAIWLVEFSSGGYKIRKMFA